MRYYLLYYTDKIKEGFAGQANAFVIRIRPAYKDDRGLLEHEKCHCRQWWITLGLHSILYLLSKRYKLWAEVQAYKVQLKYPPASTGDLVWYKRKYAIFLVGKYGLDITIEEAYGRL